MINQDQLFSAIKELLISQHFAVLATQADEYPYCSLVGYAHSEDIKEILFSTIRNTRKYGNLKKNAQVSLLIDNQTNKVNDFKEAQALTVLGKAEELADATKQKFLSLYLQKHPYLEDFVTAPNCALIKIKVAKYILVQNFQNVYEYTLS